MTSPFEEFVERSAIRRVDQRLQARSQLGRVSPAPVPVNQPHVEQVAKVCPILVAKRGQLDSHKSFEIEHAKLIRWNGFGHVGVGQQLLGTYLFTSENDMHGIPRSGTGAIEEQLNTGSVRVVEAGC